MGKTGTDRELGCVVTLPPVSLLYELHASDVERYDHARPTYVTCCADAASVGSMPHDDEPTLATNR